ncbi:hypothetical protein HPB50_028056 [Hyalomma asiaticum]|nr:hypothetical protein HPB50_028056 [Hyalomma asiaticum]
MGARAAGKPSHEDGGTVNDSEIVAVGDPPPKTAPTRRTTYRPRPIPAARSVAGEPSPPAQCFDPLLTTRLTACCEAAGHCKPAYGGWSRFDTPRFS